MLLVYHDRLAFKSRDTLFIICILYFVNGQNIDAENLFLQAWIGESQQLRLRPINRKLRRVQRDPTIMMVSVESGPLLVAPSQIGSPFPMTSLTPFAFHSKSPPSRAHNHSL